MDLSKTHQLVDMAIYDDASDVIGINSKDRFLGVGGALELAQGLQYNNNARFAKRITLADASITDEGSNLDGLREMAKAFKECHHLIQLDFSGNLIGSTGLRYLLSGIQPSLHANLQSLDLSRNGLHSTGCSVLGEFFQPVYTHYIERNLEHTAVHSEAAPSEKSSPAHSLPHVAQKLESLYLDGNNITDFGNSEEGTVALTEGLHHLPALRHLRLSHNRLTPRAVRALSEFVSDSTALQELWLNENKIDSAGAKLLAHAVCISKSMQQLHLRGNAIASDGAAELAKCFDICPSLVLMDLRKNILTPWGRLSLVKALCPDDAAVQQALEEQGATEHDAPLKFMSTPRLNRVMPMKPTSLPAAAGVGSAEADAAAAEHTDTAAGLAAVPLDFKPSTSLGIPALALGKVKSATSLPAAIVNAIMPSADAGGKPHTSGEATPRGETAPDGMFEEGGHLFFSVSDTTGARTVLF